MKADIVINQVGREYMVSFNSEKAIEKINVITHIEYIKDKPHVCFFKGLIFMRMMVKKLNLIITEIL